MHFYDVNIKEVLFQVSSYHTDQKRHFGLIRLPNLRIFKCAGYRLFRRRLSAEGAKPESNNRWKFELGHVCGYVGGWVCMVF